MGDAAAEITALAERALTEIARAESVTALAELRRVYLGRRSRLNELRRSIGSLPADTRAAVGQLANRTAADLEAAYAAREETLAASRPERREPPVDVTLPGRRGFIGISHVLHSTLADVVEIFYGMGFTAVEGPDVEDDFHNFEGLNIPAGHPARDMQDTFYLEGDTNRVLRTQTSSVQVRVMESTPPPIRIVSPGRVYRNEPVTPTHFPEFHQVEGLYVDRDVSMADLKGCLYEFVRRFFGADRALRFRASYFPFTEPSAEVDMSCLLCGGTGCGLCKGSGWIEILGSGLVHPRVLRCVGYDPDVVSGYAFGIGIERLAMLRHGIPDVRMFFENDVRVLSQFA
jgi:phenylalanyl-tRNA synthetase alpha chain